MAQFLINILTYFGFYCKKAKIVLLGLDNAGKTTLLYILRDDKIIENLPSNDFESEEVLVGKIKFRAFDLGNGQKARQAWKKYYKKIDGMVFLIDTTDKTRFLEVKKELNFLLNDYELRKTPFLILANKIDHPEAIREEELKNQLGLDLLKTEKLNHPGSTNRPLALFMCSVVKKIGYGDGFRWLAHFL